MTGVRHPERVGILAAVFLWGLWALTALPLFVLLVEFGCGDLGKCGNEALYYAKFYSHFFLYPVTFGLISAMFLTRPWIRSVHYLFSLPGRIGMISAIAVSMFLVVGFASYAEFTRATPAVWSFTPAVLSNTEGEQAGSLKEARDLLKKRCMPPASELSDEEKNEEKTAFKEKLEPLWENRGEILSYTAKFYRVGFVAMTTLFAILFLTIFIAIAAAPKATKDQKATTVEPMEREMMVSLASALLFAAFWVLMRITFLIEKTSVYPEDPLLILNYFIFLVFVVLYVYLISADWTKPEPHERYLHTMTSTAGIFTSVMVLLREESMSDVLVHTFGTGGSHLTYITVFLFLLVVYFPHLLHLLKGDPKPKDSYRQT